MSSIEDKFSKLGAEFAPGQEVRQNVDSLSVNIDKIPGTPVDFSHGDIDAHEPIPGTKDAFNQGVELGGAQAYTEYRGSLDIREDLAAKLTDFSGWRMEADKNLLITPGTQGALFLAMGALVSRGDKVAIVEPDYFANRKLVHFFDGELVPVQLNYFDTNKEAGLDLNELETAFKNGVKTFLFSNPNNPTGVIYSQDEIKKIAALAEKYGVSVIIDELYSRQLFDERDYAHLIADKNINSENVITIIGPSKTESLSGYRLGVAFGSRTIIERMEKLQAIVSLRASGYNQAVLKLWFNEPSGWMKNRIESHQAIRDDLVKVLNEADGFKVRPTEAGSYLFPEIPAIKVPLGDFVKALRVQAGVTVTPGTEFGPGFENSFRVNFSQNHQAAVDAMKRIIQVVEALRK
ncbi:pyridoxal phosphate-dependent aminotransferase [Jeotgalicoccus meleagridis]|uniref:Aspartate aminotransferase n=1 Tax=Jeotgalicoccus meleagridis TaxID=2759181 RepID=A0A6V7RDM1_9STAP|nr:pyridoxal phosphate-dependent aminotransferase [Jeotgalicoccus meleagridis]CAD2075200.1 Aspartate aminotransferase [Jeotgalicoccus meleagridis]